MKFISVITITYKCVQAEGQNSFKLVKKLPEVNAGHLVRREGEIILLNKQITFKSHVGKKRPF